MTTESGHSPIRYLSAFGCFVLILTWAGCGGGDAPDENVADRRPEDLRSPSPQNADIRSAALPQVQSFSDAAVQGTELWFADVTAGCRLNFAYRDGSEGGCYQLLESVGGGVFSFDADADGWQDLFICGGGSITLHETVRVAGRPGGMWRNRNGRRYEDVSAAAGTRNSDLYTHGGTVADLNSDGFRDIVVAGYHGLQVWLNQGDGTFTERSSDLGIASTKWNVSAAAADYDLDGLADLYVLTYADWEPDGERRCINDQKLRDICGPTLFAGERDILFRCDGADFQDVTDRAGLIAGNRGLGIVAADVNDDHYCDFVVVNDVQENQLYLNQDGKGFREEALVWGMAYSGTGEREGSMGVDLADFDRDGFPDVWYTNYAQQDNSLLRNSQGTGFVHSSATAGLGGVSRPWVGFGTGFADFNGDGWDDLYVINGHVAYERRDSPYFQPPQLFEGQKGKKFIDVSGRGGTYFLQKRSGRGSALTDFDNNGTPDLIVVHQNDPVTVLRNNHEPADWIRLRLVGIKSERDAVGASVRVAFSDGSACWKWRIGGGSYLSAGDPRMLFSLPSDGPVTADVSWPDGSRETYPGLAPGRTHTLIQGRGDDVDR